MEFLGGAALTGDFRYFPQSKFMIVNLGGATPGYEFENLIDKDDWEGDEKDSNPFFTIKGNNGKGPREEWDVKNGKMEDHGESNGKDQGRIGPEGKGKETLVLAEAVHGIKHFNSH